MEEVMEEAIKKKKKWMPWALTGLAALVLLIVGIRVYRAYYDRKVPNFRGTYEFFVREGMEPSDVLDSLEASGVVLNKRSLRRTLAPVQSMRIGHYTVDAAQAWEITKALDPSIVIPMHYRGRGFGYAVIGTVEPFLKLAGNVKELAGMSYAVDLADAPATILFRR